MDAAATDAASHAPGWAEPAGADPGEIAVNAGLGVRDADGAVIFGPRPTSSVFRDAMTPSVAPSIPPMPEPEPAAVPAPVPGTASAATASAPAGTAAAAAPDLAAMADELYERIERRMRADLFLERERRGSLVDL